MVSAEDRRKLDALIRDLDGAWPVGFAHVNAAVRELLGLGAGAELVVVRGLTSSGDLHTTRDLRVLASEGPAALGWLGGAPTLTPREEALIEELGPALRTWLRGRGRMLEACVALPVVLDAI